MIKETKKVPCISQSLQLYHTMNISFFEYHVKIADFCLIFFTAVCCSYSYVFFGSTEPVVSRPPVEVCRGTEVVIPQSCCTFPFATTPQHLRETFFKYV